MGLEFVSYSFVIKIQHKDTKTQRKGLSGHSRYKKIYLCAFASLCLCVEFLLGGCSKQHLPLYLCALCVLCV